MRASPLATPACTPVLSASRDRPRGVFSAASAVKAGVAKGEARIGSARAYLLEVLREIAARAPRDRAIDVPDRGRVRLATANAIQGSIETADWLFKNAGVTAIFPGSPYERRFRDIHTLSQQIQSRDAHFAAVGSILLGNPPDVFY